MDQHTTRKKTNMEAHGELKEIHGDIRVAK
jgi:hypothetical protein